MFNSSPCFALKKAKRSGLKVYFKIKQKTVLYAGKYFGAKELFAYRSEVEVMKIIMLGAPGNLEKVLTGEKIGTLVKL